MFLSLSTSLPVLHLMKLETNLLQQHSITQSMHGLTTSGSREASPLSAMVTSQDSSPSAWNPTNSPSPNGGPDFISGAMLNNSMNTSWAINQHTPFKSGYTPSPIINNPSPLSSGLSVFDTFNAPVLYIHPTPLKSRVETQIPIKMTLFPMPPGITKLHLPTHTISKPKLLAKPAPEPSPDTLELYTTLVCTSAMQNPEFRRRAFARAASSPHSSDSHSEGTSDGSPDEDDENKPLNGGEVKICAGCVTRERKRAARKKVKKIEEEESWHKDESKRVIVFNTHEVKDWQPPSGQIPSEATGDRLEPIVPDGALQVDVPMRIACYCRHQNEKLGFQVIFTLKDSNDRLIAQEISSSIMITDDHKTHNIPPLMTQTSNGSDGLPGIFPVSAGGFSSESNFGTTPLPPFRNSHSSSDLQSLQRTYPGIYQSSAGTSSHPSQATSATMTPRNLSRQASPSGSSGPYAKKRKASGSSKVPSGLAMTKLETAQPLSGLGAVGSSTTSTAATTPSPYTPNISSFQQQQDLQFAQMAQSMQPIGAQFHAGPPTPGILDNQFTSTNRSQSMENLVHQMYSAPPSAHPSRAPSPTGMRNGAQAYQQHHVQLAQALANPNGFYSLTTAPNPHRSPIIHKMIPGEGPKTGGIEVTCLGSGFFQGLEVMFGDAKATTTTFWGETSLVCLLPPATTPGPVLVTLKQQQPMQPYPTPPTLPKQQVWFNYVDDDEQQIMRTALQVLSHKMNGKPEDIRELARRIIGEGSSSWGSSTGPTSSGGQQHQHRSALNPATFGIDVEATLLKCLDLIDLDDSPRMPRLNLRRPSGQTMLHLACSLGLHRFVAALLARGANPDPRDKGGFTPMHFAAMHNHPQIVRRLMLCGADPTMRSLQGYTPADLSTTDEVLRATRRIEHHRRTRSGGSLRSLTSSATSLRSLWEPPSSLHVSSPHANESSDSDEGSQDEDDYEFEEADDQSDVWMRSRRPSAHNVVLKPIEPVSSLELPSVPGGLASPTAAMTAFRDQLTTQIQHLQHTMHLNLPNLPQMPTLPMMPNLPDYQAYLPTAPMVRRISALVPQMGTSRPGTSDQPTKDAADSRWWDLFSGAVVPTAPPAYDDIFPHGDLDTKTASAMQAATDVVADNKCAALFDKHEQAESSTTSKSALLDSLRIVDGHLITRAQRDQLRLAHAEKVKRLRSDRNLFFIWIPLLLLIIVSAISVTFNPL